MAFNFDKLWDLLTVRNISKDTLRKEIGASQTTIVGMGKNKNVSLDVIDRICQYLQCSPHEIMEHIPDTLTLEDSQDLKYGDIFLLDFPGGKLIPVIIVQNEEVIKNKPTVLVLPLSSNSNFYVDPDDELKILPTKENGLQGNCYATINNMRHIQKNQLVNKIGQLNGEDLEKTKSAIAKFMGIGK